jgi:KDO2-lipid IV(A) lauroyltransferase
MGAKILYYLVLIPLSRMPFFMLYALSDFAFFMMFYVVGYRKDVVYKNLQNSFPEKDEKELKFLQKQFFKHLCDLIVESIKGFTISKKQIMSRVSFKNNEVIDKYFDQGKSVVIISGHYNNWEMVGTASGTGLQLQGLGIYKPLSNKFFDRKMRVSRERHGIIMVPMKETLDSLKKDYGRPYGLMFAADQTPSNVRRCYWLNFLNQETPVFFGPEKIAKDFDLPVIYSSMYKRKRGHYEVVHRLITEEPKETAYGEITKAHVKILEDDIKLAPQFWLWSHKRWKHKRPEDIPFHED